LIQRLLVIGVVTSSHSSHSGNATLSGFPQYLLRRLQSVMNSTARLVFSSSFSDMLIVHVTYYSAERHSPAFEILSWVE